MKFLQLLPLVGFALGAVVPQDTIDINIRVTTRNTQDNGISATDNETVGTQAIFNPNRQFTAYDSGAPQWSGYLPIPSGRNLFFWSVCAPNGIAACQLTHS